MKTTKNIIIHEFKQIKSGCTSHIYKTKSTKISELVQRYFDTNCHPTNKKITKKTIPVSSKAPSSDPILHRNPLSSLPPEATSDASVGLHATVKTSSVPRKMEGTIKGVLV